MRSMLALAVAFALAGCATDGGDHPVVEKVYRTGSNIPVTRTHQADDAVTVTGEDVERARDAARRTVPASGH